MCILRQPSKITWEIVNEKLSYKYVIHSLSLSSLLFYIRFLARFKKVDFEVFTLIEKNSLQFTYSTYIEVDDNGGVLFHKNLNALKWEEKFCHATFKL